MKSLNEFKKKIKTGLFLASASLTLVNVVSLHAADTKTSTTTTTTTTTSLPTAASFPTRQLRIGYVNFKTCVEKSKLGQQEQGTFDAMKKQMETILGDKEKLLNELATKLGDSDYLDSLAPEAETELKRKFRSLSQELTQAQNQYYQSLQQANFKIIQKIADSISEASEKVAKDLKLDALINEDGTFYYASDLDVSSAVIVELDLLFEKELKEAKEMPPVNSPSKK